MERSLYKSLLPAECSRFASRVPKTPGGSTGEGEALPVAVDIAVSGAEPRGIDSTALDQRSAPVYSNLPEYLNDLYRTFASRVLVSGYRGSSFSTGS